MKLVDRAAFLALPPGTFYAKAGPENSIGYWGPLAIKDESLTDDWWYLQPVGVSSGDEEGREISSILWEREQAMRRDGASFPLDDDLSRDGLFDANQMFLIFERDDLLRLRAWIDIAIDAGESV